MTSRPAPAVLVVMLALVAVSAGALAGCSSPAAPATSPSASRSAAPSSTPTTKAANKAAVVIDGKGVTVLASDGHAKLDLTWAVAADSAVSQLNTALGETASTSTVSNDPCYPELDEASWGGLHVWSTSDGLTRPEEAQYYVTADAAATASGLAIRIPSGQSVGATQSQVLSANTSSPSFDDGDSIDLHYDIVSGTAAGDPDDYYGALATIKGGKLVEIDSPLYYSRPC